MKIYQVIALNCKENKNKRLLIKEAMQAIKFDKKPTINQLEKIAKIIAKKYNISVFLVTQRENEIICSIKIKNKGYNVIHCLSYYEALCKYILIAKELYNR